jgi:hypothetical protein
MFFFHLVIMAQSPLEMSIASIGVNSVIKDGLYLPDIATLISFWNF